MLKQCETCEGEKVLCKHCGMLSACDCEDDERITEVCDECMGDGEIYE